MNIVVSTEIVLILLWFTILDIILQWSWEFQAAMQKIQY